MGCTACHLVIAVLLHSTRGCCNAITQAVVCIPYINILYNAVPYINMLYIRVSLLDHETLKCGGASRVGCCTADRAVIKSFKMEGGQQFVAHAVPMRIPAPEDLPGDRCPIFLHLRLNDRCSRVPPFSYPLLFFRVLFSCLSCSSLLWSIQAQTSEVLGCKTRVPIALDGAALPGPLSACLSLEAFFFNHLCIYKSMGDCHTCHTIAAAVSPSTVLSLGSAIGCRIAPISSILVDIIRTRS